MEYSKENTMTRKEYLKSKKKNKFSFSKLKYVLLFIVVILLGIYVFKQLNIYNNVTQIANKVVEESKLAKTMTMYYVSETYTKDGESTVMLYKSYDESRTRIPDTEDFKNIKIIDNKLYGVCDNKLYKVDLITYEKELVVETEIKDYEINSNYAYLLIKDGVIKCNLNTKETKKIIDNEVYQIRIDQDNLYAITEGKTSKSIIKHNLDGNSKKELSEKYIVSGMYVGTNDIFFINSKDSKLYRMTKNGDNIKKLTDNKIDNSSNIVCYKDNLYYINKSDSNTLYNINLKTGKEERVIKKNIKMIQMDETIIYYSLSSGIGIYKFNIETGKTAQVTSARTNEYICIN